jgi:hypothetical protein
VIANGLVYVTEVNHMNIGVFTTGGNPVAEIPTGEPAVQAVVAHGEVFVTTWNGFSHGYLQAFGP